MRVAMISVHSSPLAQLGGKEAGGMNVYVRELARELGRRGVLVDIFTRRQDSSIPTVVPLDHGVRVVHLQAGPAAPYDKNVVLDYLPDFVSRMRCFADDHDLSYDLIHSHYWLSGEVTLMLRQAWHVPVVHMFHTLGALKNQIARSREETESARRLEIERRLMQQVDVVVAATPLDRAHMVWHYGADANRIRVVPCGVDLRLFQPQPSAEARAHLGLPAQPTRLLLCVGRMEPLKGMDALIQALALLRGRDTEGASEIEVLLVGGADENHTADWNTEQRRLHALRNELGLGDAVRFLGAQPQDLLPYYYAATDLVVVPSHYESFGMVALEAQACGTPVVASRVGGLPSVVDDGTSGLLVPHDNPDALAASLGLLLDDETLRTQMGYNARQHALDYSWSSVCWANQRIYAALLAQGIGQQAARA